MAQTDWWLRDAEEEEQGAVCVCRALSVEVDVSHGCLVWVPVWVYVCSGINGFMSGSVSWLCILTVRPRVVCCPGVSWPCGQVCISVCHNPNIKKDKIIL